MAIAHDASSESHTGTTGHSGSASYTWNHVGGASARYAVVFVFTVANAPVDTSVTYGGVSMTQIPYYAATNSGENGSVQAYFLDNCGTGTKAVVVNRTNNATVSYAVCMTGTSGSMGAEYYAGDIYTQSGTTTNRGASSTGSAVTGTAGLVSITDGGSPTASKRYMGMAYGGASILAAGTGSTGGLGIDYGQYVHATYHDTTPASGAQNVGSASGTDDLAVLAFAVREKIQVVTLGLLDSSRALYAPTIYPDLLITLPLLEQVGDLTRGTLVATDDFSDSGIGTWNSADTGGTWSTGTSSNTTYNKSPFGSMESTSAQAHTGEQYLGSVSAADVEYLVAINASGWGLAADGQGVVFRRGTNKYLAWLEYVDPTKVKLSLRYGSSGLDASGLTVIATTTNQTVLDANATFWVHGWAHGTTHKIRFWANGDNEPSTFHINTTDSSSTAAGAVGLTDMVGWDTPTSFDDFSVWQTSLGVAAPALFAPTLVYVPPSGPQDLTLGLLDAAPALYAPTVTPKNTITLGLLDAAPALYAPTVTTRNTLTLGLLDAAPALYAPTLVGKNTLTLSLLDAASALYAPTVTTRNTITLALLDAGSALYAPTLMPAQFVTLPLLDAAPDLYAPSLALVGGTQTITLGLLDEGAALYAPVIAAGPVGITLSLLDAGPALYAPTLIQDQFVTLGLLDAGSALYAPTLVGKNTLTLALLDAGPALYAPTLMQDQFITLPLLDGAPDLYAPVLSNNTIFLSLLDAGPALYAPTLIQDQFVTLALLDAGPALYAPTLLTKSSITVPYLDANAALYAPTLVKKNTITLGLLDAASALYAPTIQPGAVTLTLGLLDAASALYAPTLINAGITIRLVLLDAGAELYAPLIEGGLQLDDITNGVILQEFWPRKRKVRDPYTL